jgi:hypothetical protein
MAALDQKVIALENAFRRAEIPHAFGGAIALAYYATPRGTVDVDVNLFVSVREIDRVIDILEPLGIEPPDDGLRQIAERDEQVRLLWDKTPVDLFFAYDVLHDACCERRREVPFAGKRITILSAEDLAIFKVIFNRAKDWRDLEELSLDRGERFDTAYATSWLERILARSDDRLLRFRELRPVSEGPADSTRSLGDLGG